MPKTSALYKLQEVTPEFRPKFEGLEAKLVLQAGPVMVKIVKLEDHPTAGPGSVRLTYARQDTGETKSVCLQPTVGPIEVFFETPDEPAVEEPEEEMAVEQVEEPEEEMAATPDPAPAPEPEVSPATAIEVPAATPVPTPPQNPAPQVSGEAATDATVTCAKNIITSMLADVPTGVLSTRAINTAMTAAGITEKDCETAIKLLGGEKQNRSWVFGYRLDQGMNAQSTTPTPAPAPAQEPSFMDVPDTPEAQANYKAGSEQVNAAMAAGNLVRRLDKDSAIPEDLVGIPCGDKLLLFPMVVLHNSTVDQYVAALTLLENQGVLNLQDVVLASS